MRRKLEGARFDVTVCPMTNLTQEQFRIWLNIALELWEDRWEDGD